MFPGAKRRGMEMGMERKYYLRGLGLGIVVTAIIMGVALPGRRRMTDEQIIARAKELGMGENTLLSEEAAGDAESGDAAEGENANIEGAADGDAAESGNANAEGAADGDAAADNAEIADDTMADDTAAEGQTDGSTADDVVAEDNTAGEQTDVTETTQEQDEAGGSMADDTAAEGQIDGSAADDAAAEDNTAGEQTGSVVITIRGGDSSYTVAKKLEDLGVVASASAYDTYLCGHGYDKRLRTGTFSIPADADEEQIARIVTGGE